MWADFEVLGITKAQPISNLVCPIVKNNEPIYRRAYELLTARLSTNKKGTN
jgi:hypothetical protein